MKLLFLAMTLLVAPSAHAVPQRIFRDLKLPSQQMVEYQLMGAPAAAGTADILSAHAGNTSTAAASATTFVAQPDVPRNLVITPGGSTGDVAACNVTVTGTNIRGKVISEVFAFAENASTATTGAKAFKTVTRIDADLTAGETNKTLKMGTGNLLALNEKLGTYDQVCDTYVNGVIESTAAAVTKNSTVLSLNTVDTASVPGGYVTLVYYMLKG